jgi:ribonuclease J
MIKTTDGAGRPGHHPRVAPRSAPKHDRIDRLIDTATATAVAAMPTHPATHAGATSKYTASRQNLRVIPLGGVEEVGCNMTMFEYGDDIVIVDMGFAFPDETTPGIDYIIPDTKYLEDNKKKIRGILLTHGHLDHIGAIPYILPKIGDPPIYTLQLTAGFVKKRQVIHTGDWKLDHTPVNEKPAELHKLAQFGTEGVLLLMSDSTNSAKPGYCLSEKDLGVTLDRVFSDAKQRVVFASFSSLISRMQQVLDISAKYNRKVVVTGRSMVNNVEIALSLGYLKINKGQIIKSEQASKYPDNQITILTTGAQGEEASALARMARGEHKTVRIKRGDTVIVSASPIPGNERAIVSVLDNLTREGANVIYNKIYDIHTSGHAQQEELKLMMALTKPRYFMPIHGEHHMLVAHGKLANTVGIGEDRVKILNNGSILEINSAGEAKIIDDKIPSGYVFIDGLGIGDVGEVVLRDRQVMANDGMFVIIVTLDRRSGKLINQPDIISRGFIYMKNNDELVREVKHEVRKLTESGGKTKLEPNWAFLRQQIRDSVGEYLFQKTQRRPMILPVVIEI